MVRAFGDHDGLAAVSPSSADTLDIALPVGVPGSSVVRAWPVGLLISPCGRRPCAAIRLVVYTAAPGPRSCSSSRLAVSKMYFDTGRGTFFSARNSCSDSGIGYLRHS